MTPSVRLLIVCNIRLHCQCLAEALARNDCLSPIGFVLDAVEAFEHIKKTLPPDLLLVDWHLPNGSALDLARWVKEKNLSATILFWGLADDAQGKWACKMADRTNYILQSHSFDDLLVRIRQSHPNPLACTLRSTRTSALLDDRAWPVPCDNSQPGVSALTIREQQIVHLIEQGLSNKEIAKRLILSLHTVKNHIHNLISKLEVESRYEAVRILKVR